VDEAIAVYLAGPAGFTDAGLLHHRQVIVPTVTAAGFAVLDPWAMQGSPDGVAASRETNLAIGLHNAELIRGCAAVLAVLDGSDVDSGTAAEIGYAAALNRPDRSWAYGPTPDAPVTTTRRW
jgi:nucleoside 2-deoxyribosyltransferase